MMSDKKEKSIWNLLDRVEGDKVVWIVLIMLMLISIVCIFSSTSRLLSGTETRVDIVRSHLLTVCGGLIAVALLYVIKCPKALKLGSMLGFPLSFILLALLLMKVQLPHLKSIEMNGARRILEIDGIQLHVFEIVKVAMVMYLAWALDALKRGRLKGPRKTIWKKVLYIYAPFLTTLIMLIPGSNSAFLFIGAVLFIVILLGGGNLRDMSVLAASVLAIMVLCWGIYQISGHNSMTRIGTAVSRVFNDTDYEKIYLESTDKIERQEALDKIRQPYGATIAIKEGGLLGKGPGQSTQRYMVPDMSEDYMFSFIIEEYGLWGAILVIALYVSLLARGSIIVRNCNDLYAKLCVAGLCLLISGQAFLHMCVNVGIGPMTGQTLPLISHGRSAFLCFSVAFGVILSISRMASRKIAKEERDAEPIVQMTENVTATMDELDDFEDKMSEI